jgi:large repetitive protein
MRRIAILCGLCLLVTGAGASGATLGNSSSARPSANETSASAGMPMGQTAALGHSSSEQSDVRHAAAWQPANSHHASLILLGEQALEPTVSHNLGGTAEAFAFRARRPGMAASINVYVAGLHGSASLFAGLYSSSHGKPKSLLTSGLLRSVKAGTWNSVTVRPVSLRSGGMYWLAVLGRGGAISFRDLASGLCTGQRSSAGGLRSLPGTWPASLESHFCRMSAYVRGSFGRGGKVFGTNRPVATTGPTSGTVASVPPASSAPASPPAPTAGLSLTLPPVATAGPTVAGSAVAGQTLTTSNGTWINSPTSYAYEWERCDSLAVLCTGIGGATSSSYTLTSSDVGSTIRSVVTATNAGGSTPASSAATAVVTAPPAPSNTALPSVSGSAVQGQTLTTSNGSWTGSPTSYTYRWEDCDSSGGSCASISGATSSSYTLQAGDVGTTIRSVVTATNAGGATSASSAATGVVTAPPAPPSNTALPVISGSATQGQTLSTSNGSWTGSPTSYGYQWQDCSGGGCANISGATGSSYTLQSSDVGDTIDVVVKATNAGGSGSATSAKTASVAAAAVGGSGCDLGASSSNFASQIAAAAPGQTVCLASGDYSGFTGTSKAPPGITITAAAGAAVTFNSGMRLNPANVQNFTLDGTAGGGKITVGGLVDIETSGDVGLSKALNLTFQNLAFSARDGNVLLYGPENSNITFNRDTFVDANAACSGGSATGYSGIFYVDNAGSPTTQTGLTVENSVFVAPMDLWNPGRAVQDGAPMVFKNNVVTGFVDHTESASCNHIDGLQWYSGTNGSTGSVTFTGNLCYDNYGCAMAFDGTANNTITDNVCFDEETACISLYSDTGSIVDHNVTEGGGADPGACNTMHDTSAPIQSCTSSSLLINSHKTGDRVTTGETYTNNISPGAPNVESGSLATNKNNMWSGASSPNINGTPTFVGGTSPTTWAAFALSATSAGHAAGSDGQDVGIRLSAGGPPTGGGSTPLNTAAPSLTGTPTQGQTLTTTNGTWTITGNIPTTTTYQWFDCPTATFSLASCTPIQPQTAPTSANGPTYTLQASDAGDYVFAEVTVTNANGQVNAMSNPVGPVG